MEKVKALLASIQKNEKMNALDFEIVDEKERKEERTIGKEVLGKSEGRREELYTERGTENGKEDGRRWAGRERKREYEPERGGMEMEM